MANIFCLTKLVILSIFISFFSFPCMVLSYFFNQLQLPPMASGPEALAFNFLGEGPYAGLADGRIVKYGGPNVGFQDFAFSTPTRSKAVCDGTSDLDKGPLCGRPLGLGFNYLTKELYFVDAYFGLLVAGPNGRLATQLATGAEGVPFAFPNSLDIDPLTGIVYFTDASSVFQVRNVEQAIISRDATGRLLKYDPNTKQVTVLLRGLSLAVGTAVSNDGTFVLVTEAITKRIQKFWLKGSKANTSEIFSSLQGMPDNIKRTAFGDFWVAVNFQKLQPALTMVPTGMRINSFGTVVDTVSFNLQYGNTSISEVQEYRGVLYIGSVNFVNFVGVYRG